MGLENTNKEKPVAPAFVLEKVLRPYFKEKGYFFATEYEDDGGYTIDNITFVVKSIGYIVEVKYGSRPYEEKIKIALDELLVFIFEHKNEKDAE